MVGSDSLRDYLCGGLTVKAQGAYPKTGPDISFTNLTVVIKQ